MMGWKTSEEVASWEKITSRHIGSCLGSLFLVNGRAGLGVRFTLPDAAAARLTLSHNQDMMGSIEANIFSSHDVARLALPLPHAGIFLAHRGDAFEALRLAWGSWLGEAPGFRLVRPTSLGRREEVEWRIGFSDGHYVGAPLVKYADLKKAAAQRLKNQKIRIIGPPTAYPDWLRDALGTFGPRGTKPSSSCGEAWKQIHNLVLDYTRKHDLPVTDEQDLNQRILLTFPVWLKNRLCKEMLRCIVERLGDKALVKAVVHSLRTGQALDESSADRVWEHLVAHAKYLSARLVPIRRTQVVEDESVGRVTGLHFVDPTNPVDLVSRLTRIKRIALPSNRLAEIPAEYRQNHPSFKGRICPVDSPESEQVGLTLQLAQGATVDFDGRIHPAPHDNAIQELGFGAGLVPFYQHNDGARSMMGAKNLRQAIPVAGRQQPAVKSGGEDAVIQATKDLMELGACRSAADSDGNLALGRDLLIAYMPWYGKNFEDAIVIGQHVIDRGWLNVELPKRYKIPLQVGWAPRNPEGLMVLQSLTDGLARVGDELIAGSVIAQLASANGSLHRTITYNDRTPAIVKSIHYHKPDSDWLGGVLEYELAKQIPLGLGDKLMGRHGNKGVVGAIIPSAEMPRFPDDDKLPKAYRDQPVDILLNPHGVISRMNLGQLLETHIGWLLRTGTCTEEELRKNKKHQEPLGYPFSENIDHERVQKMLEKSGLDRYGRIQLVLPNGENTLSPVVVGFQHILRLRHIPELKSQARRGGASSKYSAKTGQAVHGRSLGGGQRIGEMEVWALAGHQTEYILEEMLGGKADSDWALRWLKNGDTPKGDLENGYPSVLHDWLFSLLIKADATGRDVQLTFAHKSDVLKVAGDKDPIRSGESVSKRITARFRCCKGGNDGCDYTIPGVDKIAVDAPSSKSAEKLTSLKFGRLLQHLDLAIDTPMVEKTKEYSCRLKRVSSAESAGVLFAEITKGKDFLKLKIRPGGGHDRPVNWPQKLDHIHLYARVAGKGGVGGNISGDELLSMIQDGKSGRSIADFGITCPNHATTPLQAFPPFGEVIVPEDGGLFDEKVFGPLHSSAGSWSDRKWGRIDLPIEIPYPIHVFRASVDGLKQLTATRRKWLVKDTLKKLGLKAGKIPRIKTIPVLPSRYRMPLLMTNEPTDDPIVSRGYRRVIQACRRYEKAESDEKKAKAKNGITRSVEVLLGLLVENLRHKTGLIRRHGLGRRVDRSARMVIVPNPALEWDHVGVPAPVVLELMGDRVYDWLTKLGRSSDLDALLKHAHLSSDESTELRTWSWWKSSKNPKLIDSAKPLFEEFLKEHPETLVLLNRQPSLHRDSFQAFHPVVMGSESGDVLQLSPLVCKGFAADFDGDEMVVHFPVSPSAQEEAKRLLPSNNLLSLASDESMAHFDQDFVLGSYWMNEVGLSLSDIMPPDLLPKSPARITKKVGADILKRLSKEHREKAPKIIHAWMQKAFESCSQIGVSFGFYELREMGVQLNIRDDIFKNRKSSETLEKLNDELSSAVGSILETTLVKKPKWSDPGLHFAAMAQSGARGAKQTRQLIGARGFLSPGATCFQENATDFIIRSPLVAGMTRDEAFWAAMNARSSMCDKKLGTGQAGDLTRRLVFALWPFIITSKDCGTKSKQRSVLNCKAKSGCCAKCYGQQPDSSYAPNGFPVGLIAAQTIGERGTQLSMQSFHASKKGFSGLVDIRNALDEEKLPERRYFSSIEGAETFTRDLKSLKEYADILDRHFHVLWRAIHDSSHHSLASAIQCQDGWANIAFQNQAVNILNAALTGQTLSLESPIGRVLYNLFGHRANLTEVASS